MTGVRYFFASFPSTDEARATLERVSGLNVAEHHVALRKLHMTWAFLGTYATLNAELESRAIAAGDALRCQQVQICFDKVEVFGTGRRPATMGVHGIRGVRLSRRGGDRATGMQPHDRGIPFSAARDLGAHPTSIAKHHAGD